MARHITQTYLSKDEGATWRASNILDLGGRGHYEGTVEELRDGRLWLLVRMNLDRFWEAFPEDDGFTWRVFRPSQISASSSPGMLKRLKSGRLVLICNQLYPDGQQVTNAVEESDQIRQAVGTVRSYRSHSCKTRGIRRAKQSCSRKNRTSGFPTLISLRPPLGISG